jgi:formylglycine-generating enzyme required for sulfatase activity
MKIFSIVFFLFGSIISGWTQAVQSVAIPGSSVSFNMISVPSGSFLMGSPATELHRNADEGPQVKVKLDGFSIAETEVTWELYELFTDKEKRAALIYSSELVKGNADAVIKPSTPYLDPSYGMGKYSFPATSMTQYAALSFCKWLSELTGEFYRLPTEAEWEYACKAGTNTAYSFGDDPSLLDQYAWSFNNSEDKYHPVKSKKPNPWGLYDMHGNVMEWTLDQYQADYYATLGNATASPWRRPDKLLPRTARGGSWDENPPVLRSSARTSSNPSWQRRDPQIPKSFWWCSDAPFIGIRLVKPTIQPSKEEQEEFWSLVLDEG